jgi:hypothetical protein
MSADDTKIAVVSDSTNVATKNLNYVITYEYTSLFKKWRIKSNINKSSIIFFQIKQETAL